MDLDKINELVSEKVMSICAHVLHEYKKDNRNNYSDYTVYRCRKCKKQFSGLGAYEGKVICPNYSSDIAAAMEIVEELKKSFYAVSINIYQDCNSVIVWDDDIKVASSQEGKELPECIALAALKAKGIKVGV